MYCANCGKELVEGANYCAACGSRAAVAERMAAVDETTPEKTGGVHAALESGRSRSRLRMTPLILLVLALALTAGVAVAAYYVYTEVYLPSVENMPNESRSSAGGEATSEQAPEASYSFSYVSLPGGDTDESFVYPVITSSVPNDALSSLNDMMREKVQNAAENSITMAEKMSYNPSNPGDTDQGLRYMTCKYIVTYLGQGVVSILGIDYQMHIYNAHGIPRTECITINLETGERIAPESVVGIDKNELYAKTYDAALEQRSATSQNFEAGVQSVVDNSVDRFFLVPSGIAFAFDGYDFVGVPSEFGAVVVYSNGNTPEFKQGLLFNDYASYDQGGFSSMSVVDLKNYVLETGQNH